MPKKQIIIRNNLEKMQKLISQSIPFTLRIDTPIIKARLMKPDGSFEIKAPTDDFKNVLDWLWYRSKKHYPERFEEPTK